MMKTLSAILRKDRGPKMNARLIDLIPEYEETQKALNRRPRGIARYMRSLHAFSTWMGPEARLSDFTRDAVIRYRDSFGKKNAAASTVINELATLSNFADWLIERELVKENPTIGIARPKKKEPDPQPLTIEQVGLLIDAIKQPSGWMSAHAAYTWRRNRRIVFLGLFAGLRLNEIRELRWGNCIFNVKIPYLNLQDGTKNGKPRRVAIHPDLLDELLLVPEEHRRAYFFVCGRTDETPLAHGGIEHVFDRWLARDLNIDEVLGTHLHAHKLRTTFASHFMWGGGNVITLQSMMGHKDLNTLRRYVLTKEEDQMNELVHLPYGSRRKKA